MHIYTQEWLRMNKYGHLTRTMLTLTWWRELYPKGELIGYSLFLVEKRLQLNSPYINEEYQCLNLVWLFQSCPNLDFSGQGSWSLSLTGFNSWSFFILSTGGMHFLWICTKERRDHIFSINTWVHVFLPKKRGKGTFGLNTPIFVCVLIVLSLMKPTTSSKDLQKWSFFIIWSTSFLFLFSLHSLDSQFFVLANRLYIFSLACHSLLFTPPTPFSSSSTTILSYICNPHKNYLLQQRSNLFSLTTIKAKFFCFFKIVSVGFKSRVEAKEPLVPKNKLQSWGRLGCSSRSACLLL